MGELYWRWWNDFQNSEYDPDDYDDEEYEEEEEELINHEAEDARIASTFNHFIWS